LPIDRRQGFPKRVERQPNPHAGGIWPGVGVGSGGLTHHPPIVSNPFTEASTRCVHCCLRPAPRLEDVGSCPPGDAFLWSIPARRQSIGLAYFGTSYILIHKVVHPLSLNRDSERIFRACGGVSQRTGYLHFSHGGSHPIRMRHD
jgi:hypothetical protein